MNRYRGYMEAFIEVDAKSEEEAESLMQERLAVELRMGRRAISLWCISLGAPEDTLEKK